MLTAKAYRDGRRRTFLLVKSQRGDQEADVVRRRLVGDLAPAEDAVGLVKVVEAEVAHGGLAQPLARALAGRRERRTRAEEVPLGGLGEAIGGEGLVAEAPEEG